METYTWTEVGEDGRLTEAKQTEILQGNILRVGILSRCLISMKRLNNWDTTRFSRRSSSVFPKELCQP